MSADNPTVKIFVSHRIDLDSRVVDHPLYYPIRSGAIYDKSFDKSNDKPAMQGDDTGDNISDKNFSYCELTAQYWAWKNVDADYYGFCHYRRYFSFNPPPKQKPDGYANVVLDFLDEKLLSQIICEPNDIIVKMNGSPLALTTPFNVRNAGLRDVYDQYVSSDYLHRKDIDILLDVIHDISPEFDEAAKEHIRGPITYPCNMFIMKKDLFFRYCAWLFAILAECEKRIDLSNYNVEELRLIGHLGERCLGIFYAYLNKNENVNAVIFQRLLIQNTTAGAKIYPRFKNQITVVTASNDYYIPYVAAMIQSLLEKASTQNKYGLYILHTTVSAENQKKIKALEKEYPNAFIEFYDMSLEIKSFSFKVSRPTAHISNETFYRTIIHKVFAEYDKVLYLDSDMIIRADVAELFKIDIRNNLICACIDSDFAGSYCSDADAKHYADKTLQLQEPLKYFQCGVTLINIGQFRKEFDDYLLANMAVKNKYRWNDQDVLNVCCHGKVFFFDQKWNVMVQHKGDRISTIRKAPFDTYRQYINSRDNPNIIHYAGAQKPWDDPEMDYAEDFWNVAKLTSFYEILLNRMEMYRSRKGNQENIIKNRIMNFANVVFPKGTLRRRCIKKMLRIFSRD